MEPTNAIPIINQIGNALPANGIIHLHWPAIVAIVGWITHANWGSFQTYCDTRTGGAIPFLFHLLVGRPQGSGNIVRRSVPPLAPGADGTAVAPHQGAVTTDITQEHQ
jgi:hypothetical protein